MDYGYLIRKFNAVRKEHKISTDDLANATGISRQSISRFENGGDIKVSNLIKLLNGIGKTLDII